MYYGTNYIRVETNLIERVNRLKTRYLTNRGRFLGCLLSQVRGDKVQYLRTVRGTVGVWDLDKLLLNYNRAFSFLSEIIRSTGLIAIVFREEALEMVFKSYWDNWVETKSLGYLLDKRIVFYLEEDLTNGFFTNYKYIRQELVELDLRLPNLIIFLDVDSYFFLEALKLGIPTIGFTGSLDDLYMADYPVFFSHIQKDFLFYFRLFLLLFYQYFWADFLYRLSKIKKILAKNRVKVLK